jgi:exodeoxyribonuclease VII large subunit
MKKEISEMEKTLTLYELNSMVRNLIDLEMPDAYWVHVELSEAREVGGHCYMELIQKEDLSNTPIAKASAKCWRSKWTLIRPHFERITGQRIHAGMKVLLQVHAQFHENYGFSWIVDDIDPTFTMGDMARKRMEIVRQLKAEGVFELQKELQIPMFAQRVAVISSENAAGYGDFCNQLADNGYDLKFSTQLFPAVMQGEGVEQSIVEALNRINEQQDDFDVVVIIRGGGATSDLSGFDTLTLAENVANFPLPIITGIGHERDESVLDMISNTRVKTPTAAAAFLIDNLVEVYSRVVDAQDYIVKEITRRLQMEKIRLNQLFDKIPMLFRLVKAKQDSRLDGLLSQLIVGMQRKLTESSYHVDALSFDLRRLTDRKLSDEKHRLEMFMTRSEAVDPKRLLKRGYSITLKDGKAIRDIHSLKSGDEIETQVEKGTVRSIVK